MARISLIFLAFLIALQVASASFELDSISTQYSKGDEIRVRGSFTAPHDGSFLLAIDLLCNGDIEETAYEEFQLMEGGEFSFERIFKTAGREEGSCRVDAKIEERTIAEMATQEFSLSNEITGALSVADTVLEPGKPLNIFGRISSLSGKAVNGYAFLELFKEGVLVSRDKYLFYDGQLFIEKKMENLPGGVFEPKVQVYDTNGNAGNFSDISSIKVGSVLNLDFTINKQKVFPGDTIRITGSVKDLSGTLIKKAQVRFALGNAEDETKIRDGQLDYTLDIPELIKSGGQELLIHVKDNEGNVEDTFFTLAILPVPSEIEFALPKLSYRPLEAIETSPILKDQAGAIMEGEITALIKQWRRIILSQTTPSGEAVRLLIPQYTKPGTYTLIFHSNGAETKKEIEVEKYQKADFYLENNQTLVIENSGNVKNRDMLEVFAGENVFFQKSLSLSVAEPFKIDLPHELPTGTYVITSKFGNDEKTFNDVSIIGKKRIPVSWFYKFLVLFLIILLGYAVWDRRKEIVEMASFKKRKKENEFGKPTSGGERPYIPSREEEIRDFRERTLRDIRETEKKRKREEDTNPFRMFD